MSNSFELYPTEFSRGDLAPPCAPPSYGPDSTHCCDLPPLTGTKLYTSIFQFVGIFIKVIKNTSKCVLRPFVAIKSFDRVKLQPNVTKFCSLHCTLARKLFSIANFLFLRGIRRHWHNWSRKQKSTLKNFLFFVCHPKLKQRFQTQCLSSKTVLFHSSKSFSTISYNN